MCNDDGGRLQVGGRISGVRNEIGKDGDTDRVLRKCYVKEQIEYHLNVSHSLILNSYLGAPSSLPGVVKEYGLNSAT